MHSKLLFTILSHVLMLTSLTIYSLEFNSTQFFWNVPSEKCTENNIHIPLKKFGIISNDNQAFNGNRIVLIYEVNVGLYPYLKKTNGSIESINGGIPQRTNITAHLEKLRNNIDRIIPNPKFNGPAIIDVEEWRPTYDSNWSSKRIYREESIKYVYERYPNISRKDAIEIAKGEFDRAALNFLLKTLKECQILRPLAIWGFYGMPICDENGLTRNSTFCYPEHDNRLISFLKYTDALYPSAYLYPGRSYAVKSMFVEDVITETMRLNDFIEKEGYSKKKIYVYHKFELDPYDDDVDKIEFYDPYQLCVTYKQSVEYGVDGLILWSTSKNMKKRCKSIQRYVEKELGFYVSYLGKFFDKCSDLLTSNNGKCVLRVKKKDSSKCDRFLKIENFKASCETGFYG